MTSKKNTATTDETAVAKQGSMAVGPVIDYGQDAGGGFENQTAADMAIPFLNLLQDNSPQVKKASDKRIDGAEAGMFHNTVTDAVLEGETGLVLVPVTTEHCYVLWKPRDQGGGFQGRLELNSREAQAVLASGRKNDKGIPLTEQGFEMKETFYIYAMILAGPDAEDIEGIVVIPFVSTKIKAYRHYMSKVRQHKQLAKAPLYAHRARLKAVPDSNQHGDFFTVSLEPVIDDGTDAVLASALPPGHPLLALGRDMKESIQAGTRQAAYDSVSGDGDGESSDSVF